MLKRLVATIFVASLAVFGLSPAATAAPSSDPVVKVVKVTKFKPTKPDPRIDWDAPPADSGLITTLRIDWD